MAARLVPALIAAALLAVGCNDDGPTVVVVRLDARPGLGPPYELDLTVRNGTDEVMREYLARPVTFPQTFSVTPHQRTGTLVAEAHAIADDGRTASGSGQADIRPSGRTDIEVVLEADDYVLNSRQPGAQFPTFGLAARQLGAAGDGSLVMTYEEECAAGSHCEIWARMFDLAGTPRPRGGSDDSDFTLDPTTPAATLTEPALAVSPSGAFLGSWRQTGTPGDVRGRLFHADGTPASSGDFSLLTSSAGDLPPGGPAVAAFPDGRFLVVWSQERNQVAGTREPLYVHGRIIRADGSPGPDFVINQPNPASPDPHANDDHVAPYGATSADGSFVVTWSRGSPSGAGDSCVNTFTTGPCEVRARFYDSNGTPSAEENVDDLAVAAIQPVAAAQPDGYLVVWADRLTAGYDDDDYGILARHYDHAGTPLWAATATLNTTTAGTQAEPAIAALSDGRLLVAWTDCSSRAEDSDDCGVRGRVLLPFGLPVGGELAINTTYAGKQDRPSVAALKNDPMQPIFFAIWADQSGAPPDSDGDTRGRLLYPILTRSDGVLGAACDGNHPCAGGFACVPRAGGGAFCHLTCTTPQAPCPVGGDCMAVAGQSVAACQYP
jgi:hypothetical protein